MLPSNNLNLNNVNLDLNNLNLNLKLHFTSPSFLPTKDIFYNSDFKH